MNRSFPKAIVFLIGFALLSGCSSTANAPVINKSPNRQIPSELVVTKGESLYEISWRYGLDYLAIAKWNGLKKPYSLKQGQLLALRPGAKTNPVAISQPIISKPLPATTKPTATKPATTQTAAVNTPTSSMAPLAVPTAWRWPAKGQLLTKFSRKNGVNGIRIGGQPGNSIKSTAAGDVVYVGDGLRGYGNLIIVKHSEKYLSAYAHNRKILVTEGQRVKAGQQIAEMGSSGADKTMLHFEIRVNGKPQDPLKFLGG